MLKELKHTETQHTRKRTAKICVCFTWAAMLVSYIYGICHMYCFQFTVVHVYSRTYSNRGLNIHLCHVPQHIRWNRFNNNVSTCTRKHNPVKLLSARRSRGLGEAYAYTTWEAVAINDGGANIDRELAIWSGGWWLQKPCAWTCDWLKHAPAPELEAWGPVGHTIR